MRSVWRLVARPLLCLLVLLTLVAKPASAATDGATPRRPRVIGGQDAAPGQFPWVAALALHDDPRDYDAQFCGGTVIAPLWVLTAAHCVIDSIFIFEEDDHVTVEVEPMPASELDVVLAKTDLRAGGGERHRAAQIVLHPTAGFRLIGNDRIVPVNDMALVRLRTPTGVTPVPLAQPGQQALWRAGIDGEVVGWGSIVDPGGKTPPSYPSRLQHAAIPVVADSTCSSPAVHGSAYSRSSMLCAGAPLVGVPGRGACYGDSGGPLVVRDAAGTGWLQAGIVSWGGATCASSGQPGVYARVAPLSPWVSATTAFGPFAGAKRFVRGQFRDFAFGIFSASEFARWVSRMEAGDPPSRLITALNDGDAWQQTAGTVDRLYRAAFARLVDDRAMAYWIGRLVSGWTPAQVATQLARSAEFAARYGVLDDPGYVDRLYQNVLGRTGDPHGVAFWVGRLRAGLTRGQLLARFAGSPEFRTRVSASSSVVTTWYGMLRHVPTGPEATHWSTRPPAELIDTLLASGRYASRI